VTDAPELLIDLIDQSEKWVDAKGRTHQIADMPTAYIRRVVDFLTARAGEIEFAYGVKDALAMDASNAPEDVVNDMLRQQQERALNPIGWLRATPLMQRFKTELDKTQEGAPW